jgi:hypothetical protein
VKPYWHPEIATPSQQKAKEQSSSAGVEDTQPIFAGVTEMAEAKNC